MTTTARLSLASATNTTAKALVFGTAASLALVLGMAHAQSQRELRATAVVTLDPVVIHIKRQQLPTVYITGRRAAADEAVATAGN